MLPNSLISEARLYARLTTTAINGFATLEQIPAPCVLRLLNRNLNIQKLMVEFLRANSGPVARSLAENMFQAAIQADNVEVVRYLLNQTNLVDANNTICYHFGGKGAPLIIAGRSRSFKTIKLLISRKVDVNKVISSGQNVLDILITDFRNIQSTLDDAFLEIVDALLEAKTSIPIHCISRALQFTDLRLAIRLIKGSTIQQILKFIYRNNNLYLDVIGSLRKQDAANIIRVLVGKVSEVEGDLFVSGLRDIENALRIAVRRGYDEVVEILLPYSLKPGAILDIALKTRNQAMIELILQRYPDKDVECIKPLIAALDLRDQNHLRCLEESGLFNRLQGNRKLNVALSTAIEVGNSEYATKILDMDPDLEFPEDGTKFDYTACFNAALAHNLDNIAWDMLTLGRASSSDIMLLHVAIRQRKLEFVKAITESGLARGGHTRSYGVERGFSRNSKNAEGIEQLYRRARTFDWVSVLEAAIKCGDDSILTYILQINRAMVPGIDPSVWLLDLALEKGRPSLLYDIVESANKDDDQWKIEATELAIFRESILLLDILLDFGAKLDDTLLWRAVATRPVMIGPLLERYWKIYPKGLAQYGLNAVVEAIEKYPESPGLLDMLFASKLITVGILRGNDEKNPLCHAIKNKCPISLIKRLLDAGGDVNYVTPWSEYPQTTAFLDSIGTGNMELVELFIQYGADLNKPPSFGVIRTPLQKAVEANNLRIVRLLLDKGADVNAPPATFFGATALQLTAIRGNLEMVKLLVEHGVKFDVPPPRGRGGRWPLEGAAEHGRLDMIMLLWRLNGGAFDNKQCQMAMRLAEKNGHLGCRDLIEELIANDAVIHQMVDCA